MKRRKTNLLISEGYLECGTAQATEHNQILKGSLIDFQCSRLMIFENSIISWNLLSFDFIERNRHLSFIMLQFNELRPSGSKQTMA